MRSKLLLRSRLPGASAALALCCAAILGAATLSATPARAHAFLKLAIPAVGSTVRAAPAQVVIAFTEGVEPRFCTLTVQDAAGARVDDGAVHREGDDSHLAVGLRPLPPGTYTVTWHATAIDTHRTEGSYSFTVMR